MTAFETQPKDMQTCGRPDNPALCKENFDWFRDWLGRRYDGKLKVSKATPCHMALYRGTSCPAGCRGRSHYAPEHVCLSPEHDHENLWVVNGKVVALTSEPYWTVDDWRKDGTLAREQAWAEAHGLELHVFDRSWWNAPSTILLVFIERDHGAAIGSV